MRGALIINVNLTYGIPFQDHGVMLCLINVGKILFDNPEFVDSSSCHAVPTLGVDVYSCLDVTINNVEVITIRDGWGAYRPVPVCMCRSIVPITSTRRSHLLVDIVAE